MTAYISARFEKDTLIASSQTRIVVRNIDNGAVPPAPTATYFPTHPDDYQTFIVAEYVNDTLGESFVRAATLADFSAYSYRPMSQIEDASGNFALAQVGDTFEIFLSDPTIWTSEEYPASNFIFTVTSVIDNFNITVSPELPAFKTGLSWQIRRIIFAGNPPVGTETVITQGTVGKTRRPGLTYVFPPIQLFLEKRFNAYFTSSVGASNFVEATKQEMIGLANELVGATITDETFTAGPTV